MSTSSDTEIRFGRGGSRLPWNALPPRAREQIEERVGGRVVSAETQPGGFSPGIAARVVIDNGHRVFVKAGGSELNPLTPKLHRAEAKISSLLPPEAPVPRLLFTYDDGEWVALVFEDVDGHTPLLPWDRDELARVLNTFEDLAQTLTPSHVAVPQLEVALDTTFRGWHSIAEESPHRTRIDPWAHRHLDHLVKLEEAWTVGASGNTLVHGDIRADNLLITAEKVYVIDWPHACIGPRWMDLLLMLPSVAMQGGPKPWEVFDHHPIAHGTDEDVITRMVCALAGFFTFRSLLPPPPSIPNVREFQRMQGEEALAWLKRRTGWY